MARMPLFLHAREAEKWPNDGKTGTAQLVKPGLKQVGAVRQERAAPNRPRTGLLVMQKVNLNSPEGISTGKNVYRNRIDLLRDRIRLLRGEDKLLMTMYFENGNTFRQLAKLAGVNESNIARRINRITKRLLDSKYITCLRNRDKFTKTEMAIAKDYFLLGLSQKKIAAKHNYSIHRFRRILRRIQELIRTVEGG